jgi:ferredoxin
VLDTYLRRFTVADWQTALEAVLPDVHPVDRPATRIWFHFFPLALSDAYAGATDVSSVTRRLRIDGNARLSAGQADTSHWFLYGHRYWPTVKAVMAAREADYDPPTAESLTELVRDITTDVAGMARADRTLVSGITFVGLMTLRQAGVETVRTTAPVDQAPRRSRDRSPDTIVARRARDDGQGVFGFLRSAKQFSVRFDERDEAAAFPILDSQHLTTAAAADTRDYTQGPRRFQEGPIPAQCRSATCGTCWIGVLGGQDKLSEADPYEARRLREFGYIDSEEPRPIIRLACQARASGNVTIVIPPWHGFVSRLQATGADAPTGVDA